jgi:hypothetical protein
MAYSPDEMLIIVADERKRSIGWGDGDSGELVAIREKAIQYYRGQMNDLPSMPGRSGVTSTDIAEAIETVLPDIMEVFIGGEDVATFNPISEEDQEQAEEETAYVNHVIFSENPGFLTFYTAIKDALQVRTGLFHWWWEETHTEKEIVGEPMQVQMQLADMGIDPASIDPEEVDAMDDGTIKVSIPEMSGKVCIKAWPPEDFSVSSDTVDLKDAPYCVARSRMRVQDLIEYGADPEIARSLPSYSMPDTLATTRDESGENSYNHVGGDGDLRIVEVHQHFIRLKDEDDDSGLKIYRVITDCDEGVIINQEEVSRIPFAALCPFPNQHRFFGESIADKLMEVQRIKTALLRMQLDSGYFALNQRMEVAVSGSNEYTIADLLRNEPNVPVRVATPGAIRPLSGGGLNFDVLSSLEYASTMGEARSGIVRNSQGLNPDTLHNTASGALALMSTAKLRVRMIARIFAETGVKDLFIGVREMLREGYQPDEAGKVRRNPIKARMGNKWAEIDPGKWPERSGLTIQVGVGAGGKDHDLMVANQGIALAREIIDLQGGIEGPILDRKNVYNWLSKWSSAAGIKARDMYWTNPADAPPKPPEAEQPDPEMQKVQAQMQLEQAKAQGHLQLAQAQAQSDAQLQAAKLQAQGQADVAKAERDHELAMARLNAELEMKRYQTDQELALKREKLQAELDLKRELAMLEIQNNVSTGIDGTVDVGGVYIGGEPG